MEDGGGGVHWGRKKTPEPQNLKKLSNLPKILSNFSLFTKSLKNNQKISKNLRPSSLATWLAFVRPEQRPGKRLCWHGDPYPGSSRVVGLECHVALSVAPFPHN